MAVFNTIPDLVVPDVDIDALPSAYKDLFVGPRDTCHYCKQAIPPQGSAFQIFHFCRLFQLSWCKRYECKKAASRHIRDDCFWCRLCPYRVSDGIFTSADCQRCLKASNTDVEATVDDQGVSESSDNDGEATGNGSFNHRITSGTTTKTDEPWRDPILIPHDEVKDNRWILFLDYVIEQGMMMPNNGMEEAVVKENDDGPVILFFGNFFALGIEKKYLNRNVYVGRTKIWTPLDEIEGARETFGNQMIALGGFEREEVVPKDGIGEEATIYTDVRGLLKDRWLAKCKKAEDYFIRK
ncbi:hypothetical protein QBC38DRAFT_498198 [Podospora fimiseda]|uniref:Uncharacterized protein n=1 Tax=Podospora fimiseda TaxID=252190 RepID=A0AAN7BSS5_9PEZI|nr:hypothetical protein QBC38DRAFT_498198 [Podospora fimiseda]